MMQGPKSLTATVHVRFNYDEPEVKTAVGGQVQIIAELLEHTADLDPQLQELLIKFANHLKATNTQEPKP